MIRALALLTGSFIIAAVCYAGIVTGGGIWTVGAPLQIALALGLVVGSVAIRRALSARRFALSVFLALTLAAGEGWALVGTAERTIAARDMAAMPARDNETARETNRQRLAVAEAAKRAADAAVISEAAKSGCKKECAALLCETTATADEEVAAARRAAAGIAPARSASPLADRLGYQGWQIDLLVAALASIAANGLAVGLIVFATHGHPVPARRMAGIIDVTPTLDPLIQLAPRAVPSPNQHL